MNFWLIFVLVIVSFISSSLSCCPAHKCPDEYLENTLSSDALNYLHQLQKNDMSPANTVEATYQLLANIAGDKKARIFIAALAKSYPLTKK